MITKTSISLIALLLSCSAAFAQSQQESMPGMQMPTQPSTQQAPTPAAPSGAPARQAPQGAGTTLQKPQPASTEMHIGEKHRQIQAPDEVVSDISRVQEPENPDQKTGSDLPAIDQLVEARKAARRKLEEFEQAATKSNPTLKQAEASVRSSSGLASQAGLWPNPSVGYQGEEIRGGSFGGGEHGAFIQQNIVLGGKLRLRKNVYEQQRQSDEIAVEEQKRNVLGSIRVQFYAALAAQQSVELRRQLLRLAMDASATAHQLANVGQADAPDVLQTEVEAEQAKLDFEATQQQYIQAYRLLIALAGTPRLPLALLEGNLDAPPQIDTDKLEQDIVENSPTLKRAQQEVRRAEAVLARDKREAFPDLSLRAGEQQNFEQTSAMRPAGAESFAAASIQIPIFNRNQGNVRASKAELERAQSEVERIRLNLIQTAQPLIRRYLINQLQAERYRTQMIPRAQRAYDLYLRKYQSMAAAYPQVIISQRTLFQLREKYVEALGQLWTTSQELQNYLLTNGLTAASPSGGGRGTEVNLPTGGGSAQ